MHVCKSACLRTLDAQLPLEIDLREGRKKRGWSGSDSLPSRRSGKEPPCRVSGEALGGRSSGEGSQLLTRNRGKSQEVVGHHSKAAFLRAQVQAHSRKGEEVRAPTGREQRSIRWASSIPPRAARIEERSTFQKLGDTSSNGHATAPLQCINGSFTGSFCETAPPRFPLSLSPKRGRARTRSLAPPPMIVTPLCIQRPCRNGTF